MNFMFKKAAKLPQIHFSDFILRKTFLQIDFHKSHATYQQLNNFDEPILESSNCGKI